MKFLIIFITIEFYFSTLIEVVYGFKLISFVN